MSTTADTPATPTEDALAQVIERFLAAWRGRNADAWAAAFTTDATFTHHGATRRGRDEIRVAMVAGFAGPYNDPRLHLRITVEEHRAVRDDVIVMVTRGGATRGDEPDPDTDDAVRALWVLVHSDTEGWLVSDYLNTRQSPS